ncbi:MAG TPA: polysaccharide biosynthesis protein, partial [Clostridia bacterium]|nr:polysaccharide biosynthesis protein [Clostridia bacterium]
DIDIEFTGARPGEKLYEEILTAEEGTTATKHKRIFIARPNNIEKVALDHVLQVLGEKDCLAAEDVETILRSIVPGFAAEREKQVV